MSTQRCNEVAARYAARAAWTCVSRDLVGLYLATDMGVIFAKVPTKVWAEAIASAVDANGNPLPAAAKKVHIDDLPEKVSSAKRAPVALSTEDAAWLRERDQWKRKMAELQERYDALNRTLVPLQKRCNYAESELSKATFELSKRGPIQS